MECFYAKGSADPSATIEHLLEVIDGVDTIHLRLTLDPDFVDNTYGQNAIGWENSKKGHEFKQLDGSDHAEMVIRDGNGDLAMHFKIDYIDSDTQLASGFRTFGVSGGDGELFVGEPAAVLNTMTSLDRNLNERGYSSFTVDSPATDSNYTPNADAPEWDYRVVYEIYLAKAAFGPAGFGDARIKFIHASPSKGPDGTVEVEPGDCPPDWDCWDPDGCEPDTPTEIPDGPPPRTCDNDPDGCPDDCTGGPETCPPTPECTDDGDCDSGESCAGGVCVPIIE